MNGKRDTLQGLKENVIVGRSPSWAGAVVNRMRKIAQGRDEEMEAIDAARRVETEAAMLADKRYLDLKVQAVKVGRLVLMASQVSG